MFRMMVHWLLSAISLMVVSRIVPGFEVNGVQSALLAALAIGFLNATLGFVLKVITFPLAILTFGVFLIFINAVMIEMAARIVGGFYVDGLRPAFWGAAVLAVLGMLIRFFSKE